MNRSIIIPGPRVVASAACGLLCLLFVGFWIRSYAQWDSPHCPLLGKYWIQFNSLQGYLCIGTQRQTPGIPAQWRWRTFGVGRFTNDGAVSTSIAWRFTSQKEVLGLGFVTSDGYQSICMPYAYLVALSAALAASPWLRWRFSLRSLLIATTLIAVVLGLAVSFLRVW